MLHVCLIVLRCVKSGSEGEAKKKKIAKFLFLYFKIMFFKVLKKPSTYDFTFALNMTINIHIVDYFSFSKKKKGKHP